jgi:eukaryotic-like serine/threonine-protein kinase
VNAPVPPRRQTPPARSSGSLILRLVLVALAAFTLGYLITAFLFFGGRPGDDVATVPDLRGHSEPEARALVREAGLTPEMTAPLENPNVPEGIVLAQVPLPGEEVAPGSVVRITTSAGPERRRVPDVTALAADEARTLLVRSGFDVVMEEHTAALPPGRVIEITPSPGTEVEIPSTIRLVVSTGPPLSPVPDLTALTTEQAAEALEAAGLRMGQVDYDPYAQRTPGRVIGQWPAGGDQAREGSTVGITVAGPRPAAPGFEPPP